MKKKNAWRRVVDEYTEFWENLNWLGRLTLFPMMLCVAPMILLCNLSEKEKTE